MSLVRFSVAPHETLVDAFYGGLLYLCHVVVFVPLDLFRHESFPRLSACSPTPPGFFATWFILYRENVLDGTEGAFRDVLCRENVLTCTKRVCPALFPLHHPCYVSLRPCPVRTKTFSAHHRSKFRHVVRESGVFTHGKNSHEVGWSY